MSKNTSISYVESTYSRTPDSYANYMNVLKAFRLGRWDDEIKRLQEIRKRSEKEYKKEKERSLPGFFFSGIFRGGKGDRNLHKHSGLICLDWDGLTQDELFDLFEMLKMDDFIHAVWRSPSGAGLKGLVKIPPCDFEEHKRRFAALKKKYPGIDPHCRNVARLCYVCSDPELWINENSVEFQEIEAGYTKTRDYQEVEGYEDGFRGRDGDHRDNYLMSKGGEWRRSGHTKEQIADLIIGRNSRFEEPLDATDIERIIKQVWKYKVEDDFGPSNSKPVSETESENIEFDLSELEVDLNRDVEEPPNAVKIIKKTGMQFVPYKFLRLREFSVLNGWTGHKKSMMVSVIATTVLGGSNSEEFDSMRFECTAGDEGQHGVIYIDTEQGDYDILDIKRRVLASGGNIDKLKVYKLRNQTIEGKRAAVDQIFRTQKGYALIILDNIADLIWNNNNPEQAKEMETMLLNWVDLNGAHVLLVIHSNKPDSSGSSQAGGATGHIGSSLMKKAEVGMEIKEVKEDVSSSRVTFWKNRGGMRPAPIILTYVGKDEIKISEDELTATASDIR